MNVVALALEDGMRTNLDLNQRVARRPAADARPSLAAQAQYRLAVCYYKKKNFAEATAAFEKLVKDYPDQKELIARAVHARSDRCPFCGEAQ